MDTKRNKMKSSNMDRVKSATIKPFENDDYDYLINCTDLITTCQEALQENDFDPECDQSHRPKSSHMTKSTTLDGGGVICLNCDDHSSIRSPSSAASSGLGLSLEEDCSLKYCHSDEEFSSLNSTSAECFSTKALVAEFIEWLDYAENQLDSVCYCAKIATSSTLCDKPNIEKLSDDYTEDHSCEEQSCDNNLDCVNNGSTPLNCHIRSDALVDGCVNEQQQQQQHQRRKVVEQNVVIGLGQHETDDVGDVDNGCNSYATEDHEYEGVDVFYDDDDDDVDDELMMSLEMTTATSSSQPKSTKSNNPTPTKPCLSETVADWSVILTRYKAFHNEFEKIGHRFLKEINETYKQNFSGSTLSKSLRQQEERCLNLWIKSLEYLVILQESPGQRCPRHFLTATITGRDSSHTVGHRHLNNQSSTQVISSKRDLAPLSRSYNSVFNVTTIQSSTPYGVLLRHASAQHYHRPMFGKKVERMSASGGGGMNGGESSVNFRNRRVQTTRSGNTMNEQELVVDTHTLDGSGSPSADSGVFSSSTEKYEIIQKDIGYSSDADMSDAIEAHPHSADQNSSQRSARKRQIRRRRTRTARPRPWSYHADWTDWDYYQTPFACNGEHVSNEDMLNYDNENAIRKLTEFGENYETWINAEHDSDELKLLKPPVVIEKPEIEAYGEQEQPIKTDVSTSPIPFLDEKIDELNEKVVDTSSTTTTTTSTTEKIECKSTQTATKSVVDSACMTTNDGQDNSKVTSCTMVCQSCGTSTANSYSSIKFYTSLALAGLFAFFFAVTQFSPDIHKTYTRPPPI